MRRRLGCFLLPLLLSGRARPLTIEGGPQLRKGENRNLLTSILLVPERKLLFCLIEKVDSMQISAFLALVRQHVLGTVSPDVKRWGVPFGYYQLSYRRMGKTLKDIEEILVDPAWVKALFYRDPLVRFLSAYKSKCEPGHDDPAPCERTFGAATPPFKDAVARLQQPHAVTDVHWVPQAHFCGGLDATVGHYDFVSELKPETSRSEMVRMLGMVGVNAYAVPLFDTFFPPSLEENADGQDSESRASFQVQLASRDSANATAAKIAPERAPERGKHHTNADASLCAYYNDSRLVEAVQQFYKDDYLTFPLTRKALDCTGNLNV